MVGEPSNMLDHRGVWIRKAPDQLRLHLHPAALGSQSPASSPANPWLHEDLSKLLNYHWHFGTSEII